MQKICIAAAGIALFFFYQFLESHLKDIEKGVYTNSIILQNIQNEQNKKLADIKLKKLDKNVKALTGTECAKCHVAQEHLLLPLRDSIISYENYLQTVREGRAGMPSFDYMAMSEAQLNRQYRIIYAER